MDNSRNVLLALAISFAILVGWQVLYYGPKLEAERARIEAEQAQARKAAQTTAAPGAAPAPATGGAGTPAIPAGAAAPGRSVAEALAAGERVVIDTPLLKGSLNLVGGAIDDLELKSYRQTIASGSPLIRLFAPGDGEGGFRAETGWVGASGATVAAPGPATRWSASGTALTPAQPLTLTFDNGAGLIFTRTIAVDDGYMFTITDRVANRSTQPVSLHAFGTVDRFGQQHQAGTYILHEGPIGVLGERGLREVYYEDLFEEPVIEKGVGSGWLGFTDKYWAATLVPRGTAFDAEFTASRAGPVPHYRADFVAPAAMVAPGAEATTTSLLFAGAKEVDRLDAYEKALGIDRFELLIDWGWFHFLTKPMFGLIDWLYNFLGNFGLAILAVTVLVKAAFFPLANKSYASMAKMKKLQPEMLKLQERFKDDRMGMQKEMMEMYKREKVNPLAGCWPVLVQIPVFFALYKVLYITIEMRHAPFFGWIRDLSAPDPTSIFNLFGLLPFAVPDFLLIGVWPLIMGVTMFVQMQLNPTPPDKTQAMLFTWMPIVFTFMLASFPAGLVIYWAWNNSLSILQQSLIMKRHGTKIELFDNLKRLLARSPASHPAE